MKLKNKNIYGVIHKWVKDRKLKLKYCERCKKLNCKLELSNNSQKYKKDINDYEWLCRKCHNLKDKNIKKTNTKIRRINLKYKNNYYIKTNGKSSKKYYYKNKVQLLKQCKLYRIENKEKIRLQKKKYSKLYYKKNKGKIKDYIKIYRKNYKDKISKQNKLYYKKNKEKILRYQGLYREKLKLRGNKNGI